MSVDSYLHSGSTFSNDSFSRIRNVRITREENLLHFCFKIPYTLMHQSPMKFEDFRDTSQANAMKICFTFFLEFCHSIGAAKSKNDTGFTFDKIVVILEACKHATKDRFVGTRVHCFTTRCYDEMKKLETMFDYNASQSNKKTFGAGEFERHRAVSSTYSYASRICNVYLNNSSALSSIDNVYNDECHGHLPSFVFGLQHMGIENAKYNSVEDYNDNGNIVFPDEDNILRIPPDMLKPDVIMRRYLTSYQLRRVNPPEAHMTLCATPMQVGFNSFSVTLKEHTLRVDPPGLVLQNNSAVFPLRERPDVEKMLKHFRVVNIDPNEVEKHSFGFFHFKSIMSGSNQMSGTSYMSMESGKQLIYHPMLISQSELSDLDLIKIRGDLLKGDIDEQTRKEFMLSEFIQRCWGDTDANISKPLQAVTRWFNNDYNGETFKWVPHYSDMSVFANRAIRTMKIYDKLLMMSTAHHAFFLIQHAKFDSWRHEMDLHFNVCMTGDGATSKTFLYEQMIATSIPGTCPEFTYETAKSNAHDDNNNHLRNIFQEAPCGMFTSNKHTDPQQEGAFKERLTSQKTSHRRLHIDEQTGVRKQVSSVSQAIGSYFGASNHPKSKSTPAMITRFHWLESEKVHREGRNIHDCQRANNLTCPIACKARERAIVYSKFEDMVMAMTFQMIRVGLLSPPELAVADIIIDNFTILLKSYGINYEGRTIERTKILCTILTIINAKEELFHTPGGKHCDKPFKIEHLMDMDAGMVCTEEIALFAIGLMFNSIEAENHKKVLKAIWTLHSRTKEYRGMDNVALGVDIDYSYIAMDGIKRLKQQIHGTIQEAEGKIGESAIESVLFELRKDSSMCSSYEDNAPPKFRDGFPEPTNNRKFRCERLIVSGNKTYVHMENFCVFREGTSSDLFKECLNKIRHKYTSNRKILLGRRIRNQKGAVQHPHLFDTMMMQPTNQSLMISGGTVYDDDDCDIIDVGEVRSATEQLLAEDLDSYGRRQRALKLGIQVDEFHPEQDGMNRRYPGNNLRTLFRKRKRVVKDT